MVGEQGGETASAVWCCAEIIQNNRSQTGRDIFFETTEPHREPDGVLFPFPQADAEEKCAVSKQCIWTNQSSVGY